MKKIIIQYCGGNTDAVKYFGDVESAPQLVNGTFQFRECTGTNQELLEFLNYPNNRTARGATDAIADLILEQLAVSEGTNIVSGKYLTDWAKSAIEKRGYWITKQSNYGDVPSLYMIVQADPKIV